ncbi:MAG: hypothetical protein K0U98_12170 [Deltaproteobacteria bacterium]|nr:hypothetical protein [Deltaproteobacteria bacterium]
MSDQRSDSLLKQLGQLAKERQVAENEDANRDDAVQDAEGRQGWEQEASKPLGAEAQQRIVQHLEQVLAKEFPEHREPNEREATGPEQEPPLQDSTGPPIAFRPRTKRLPVWLAWPAAAALLLVVSIFALRIALEPRNVSTGTTLVAELPTYSMTVEGLTRSQRGSSIDASQAPQSHLAAGPIERKEIALGNRLRVTMTPGEAYTGSLKGRALFSCEGPWQELEDEIFAVSAQGALRLEATVGEGLPAHVGDRCELLVILGQPSALATRLEALEAISSTGEGSGEGWRATLLALEVRP